MNAMLADKRNSQMSIGPGHAFLSENTPFNSCVRMVVIVLLLGLFCPAIFAQDTVTVPKSRLEELERKEAELNKLKGDLNKTKDENAELKQQHKVDAAKIAEAPQVVK